MTAVNHYILSKETSNWWSWISSTAFPGRTPVSSDKGLSLTLGWKPTFSTSTAKSSLCSDYSWHNLSRPVPQDLCWSRWKRACALSLQARSFPDRFWVPLTEARPLLWAWGDPFPGAVPSPLCNMVIHSTTSPGLCSTISAGPGGREPVRLVASMAFLKSKSY